ncbi:MAG: TonB-dependent receptor [Cellvibrionaceae bacterium]|nr:TonB-dependent receptor [Cellvibrionaceae bacterium]
MMSSKPNYSIRNRSKKRGAKRLPSAFKYSVLAAAVINATAASVYAQDENLAETAGVSESAEVVRSEEVVVFGIRQSLENAQGVKREASTVVDVIKAADITALPDKSVVDALKRMPGVQVEIFAASGDPDHFGAEGSSALVRGLNRTLTQFNGRSTFSAGGGAGLNLSNIPAELVGAIEVSKNQTAEMIEGGIAGTIDLITRKPFDSDGQVIGGTLKGSYGDMIDEWRPEFSGVYSNRWDTGSGEWGFQITGSYTEFSQRSEGVGVFNFYERSARGVGDNAPEGVGEPLPGAPEGATLWMPPSIQARFKDDLRERSGVASSLQWGSADDNILATFEFIRSDSTLEWHERLLENQDSEGSALDNRNVSDLLEVPGVSGVNESFGSDGFFQRGELSGAGYVAATRWREEVSYVNDASFNLEVNVTEQLTFTGDLHYVDSNSKISDHTIHNVTLNRPDVWADISDTDNPQVGFLGSPTETLDSDGRPISGRDRDYANALNTNLRSAMDHQSDSTGESLAFAADLEYSFNESWISSIKGGVRFSDVDRDHKETDFDWGVIAPEWIPDDVRLANDYPQFHEEVSFGSDFHRGNGLSPDSIRTFIFPSLRWVKDLIGFEDQIRTITPVSGDPTFITEVEGGDIFQTQLRGNDDGNDAFENNERYGITEERQTAYVMLNFDIDSALPIRGNVGLRYVNIDITSSGFSIFQQPSGTFLSAERYDENTVVTGFEDADFPNSAEGLLSFLNGQSGVLDAEPEPYSEVLPSFNMTVSLSDDFLMRLGASKAIFIPDVSSLRNRLSVNANVETQLVDPDDPASNFASVNFAGYDASSGDNNPFLQPEEAINLDISFEWYFTDVGSLTAVFFDKSLENLIRSTVVRQEVTNPSNGETRLTTLTGLGNVGEASITGFELAYQQTFDQLPSFWSGFGVQANYTYLDSSEEVDESLIDTSVFGTFTDLPLEGLSESSYNLIAFYETERFNTRLAYNWRSEYLVNDRDVISARPVYNADRGELDFSFLYSFTDSVRAGIDINNLLDVQTETRLQVDQQGTLSPRNFFVSDRRLTLRLTGSF